MRDVQCTSLFVFGQHLTIQTMLLKYFYTYKGVVVIFDAATLF